MESTSTMDNDGKFRPDFADGYGVLYRAYPSLATGVNLIPPCCPLKPLDHGMKENPSKRVTRQILSCPVITKSLS